jgi:potassium-transporting ATPase KdpC subunit
MKKLFMSMKPAFICFTIMTLLCGVFHTFIITGIAQVVFPRQANGSIMKVALDDGSVMKYGSELIAQEFSDAKYLIGRPMGSSNLSAVGKEEALLVQKRIEWLKSIDPGNAMDIPVDLATASGSGADPYISPGAAEYQVGRIARARGLRQDEVRSVIHRHTKGRFLGIWGEEGVNVLKVNLALDGLLSLQ